MWASFCHFAAVPAGSVAIPLDGLSPGLPPSHAFSLLKPPELPWNFTHLPYVNPDAPKGGTLRIRDRTRFDNLNVAVDKGDLQEAVYNIYDTLMSFSARELGVCYCLLCQTVQVAADWTWIRFELRPEARWHDGTRLTVDDVIFSFETFRARDPVSGAPYNINDYLIFQDISQIYKLNDQSILFKFDHPNRDLMGFIASTPILPRHFWMNLDVHRQTIEKPLGSGPYKIASVDSGRLFVLERVQDYWGIDLPINKGQNNFERIEHIYFGDESSSFEAFKAHQFDFIFETSAKNWATNYDFPKLKEGLVKKEAVEITSVMGLNGIAFNLRKERFQDRRVRPSRQSCR